MIGVCAFVCVGGAGMCACKCVNVHVCVYVRDCVCVILGMHEIVNISACV